MDRRLLGLLLVAVVAVSSVEHGDAGAVLAVNRGAVAPSQAFSYAQVIHNHAPSVAHFVEGGNSSPAHHGVSQSRHVAGNNAVVQTVTKEVPYPVLQPYAITIEKHIPYAVSVPVAVPVDRPYPVAVPRPYLVPFERPVPVPVNKLYPYPIKYPVEVKVPVPTPVPVAKPYPVYVYNKSYDDEPAAGDDYSASVENDHD